MDDERRRQRLEALYLAHADSVLAFARHRTDPVEAQDVVAETFLVAWRHLDRVPEDAPLPWLYGVARREIASRRRASGRQAALHERLVSQLPEQRVPDHAEQVCQWSPVTAALSALAPADREVLITAAWYELSAKQAAAVLGCSPAAYAVRLHRARRRFRRALAGTAGDQPTPAPTSSLARELS